ncbi:MAG TPA: hypothetical protein VJN64_14280 [Terriglobales bacterium]|nr:hypothetical protein [Terriglobales bacterium]
MTALAIFLIAIGCGLAWAGLVAPTLLRVFGLPVALGVWRLDRRNQHLSRTQYVWFFGVFTWGLGMFLFFTISRYLEWKLLGDRSANQHSTQIIGALLIWLLAGWLFGLWTAPPRNGADALER